MISPREIDDVLYMYPGIELAASVGVPHPLYGEEVVAFVKSRSGAPIPEGDVREFCRDKLASFKIPKRVYNIDDLPKGPSGKIQRLRLVNLYLGLPDRERFQ
jgi:acyl-CoA synthetase (AMP-forming)/AMP-acid ligase II